VTVLAITGQSGASCVKVDEQDATDPHGEAAAAAPHPSRSNDARFGMVTAIMRNRDEMTVLWREAVVLAWSAMLGLFVADAADGRAGILSVGAVLAGIVAVSLTGQWRTRAREAERANVISLLDEANGHRPTSPTKK
jgi:hypothetical protein